MKNRLFLLGIAVAAFSGCTNEELTDVAQNRAIKFNPFVNNNTKAVELSGAKALISFYVFGEYGDSDGSYGTQIFNNEEQGTTYYWIAGKHYLFGAYADGNGGKLTNSSFSAADKKLTFSNYTPDDAKDLVAAISDNVQCTDATNQEKVSLSFKHMLSQVKFTFKTTDGDNYTLKISNLKVNALKTATATYVKTNDAIEWSNGSKGDYSYPDITDVAVAANEYTASSESKLVIPQAITDEVIFTMNWTYADRSVRGVRVPLNQAGSAQWEKGKSYHYQATIPSPTTDITFAVTVTDWNDHRIDAVL